LTPVALQIVVKARNLISDYDNLVPSVLDDGGLSGILTLGVMRTTLTGMTPQAVAALKSKFPEIGLHIRPGLTTSLLSDVERGQLDAAVISKPHLLPLGVVFRELTKEPMQLIASLDEPEDDPIVLLKTRPFIRFDRGAVVGALIDNWLLSNRIKVIETMELDSPEAIASMVHANLGVSIVPDLAVKPQDTVPTKRLNLGPEAPHRTLGLVHQENHLKTRALDELFDAFTNVIHKALSGQPATPT
jgi:DNA-binding transcriptional LysR family regulator